MATAEILQKCLADMAHGATIDECLARYPDEAETLGPNLRTAAALQTAPKPAMTDAGFSQRRMALWKAAQQAPVTAGHRRAYPAQQNGAGPTHRPPKPQRAPQRMLRRPRRSPLFASMYMMTTVLVLMVATLALFSLARGANAALPDDRLYGLKRTGERVQGVLMTAAGDSATWHARQVQRRLNEGLTMSMRNGAASQEAIRNIDRSVEAALPAAALLPAAERQRLLIGWLSELRTLRSGTEDASAGLTLDRTIATVETAAGMGGGGQPPVITLDGPALPDGGGAQSLPPEEPAARFEPILTPTATISATHTATATPTATPTHTATPTPIPSATPTFTPSFTATPTALPTDTPLPPPTRDDSDDDSDDDSRPDPTNTPLPTPTPTPTVEPTNEPMATPTAEPSVTSEPTPDASSTADAGPTPTDTATPPDQTPAPDETPPTEEPSATPPPGDASPTPDATPPDQATPVPEPTAVDPPVAPTEEPMPTPVEPPTEPIGSPPTEPPTEPDVTPTPAPGEATAPAQLATPPAAEPPPSEPPPATAPPTPSS